MFEGAATSFRGAVAPQAEACLRPWLKVQYQANSGPTLTTKSDLWRSVSFTARFCVKSFLAELVPNYHTGARPLTMLSARAEGCRR